MFTRCPNCRAVFEITQSDLDIADGVVRCGLCDVLFSASENFVENKPKAQEAHPSARKDFEHTWNWTPAPNSSEPNPLEPSPPETNPQETLDFGTETIEESVENAPKVLREDIAQMHSHSARTRQNHFLFAALGILGLILVLQISAFKQLDIFPKTLYSSACQWLACPTRIQRDVDAIRLLDRSVFSHPQQRDALLVSAKFTNGATHPQPFPILELSFLDVGGDIVATRRFHPSEYLSKPPHSEQLFAANETTNIKLEVADPGPDVSGYQFEFY